VQVPCKMEALDYLIVLSGGCLWQYLHLWMVVSCLC